MTLALKRSIIDINLLIAVVGRQINPDITHATVDLLGSPKWMEEVYFALRLLLLPDGN